MLNINKIKVIIIGLLAVISLLLIFIYAQILFTKPTFETFNSVKIPSVNIDPGTALKSEQPQSATQVKTDFEYKIIGFIACLLYTSPSPRDKRQSRMPSSA